jgi:hypothetical protein
MSIKDALRADSLWTVADIDRRFLKPYNLLKKASVDDLLLQEKQKQADASNRAHNVMKQLQRSPSQQVEIKNNDSPSPCIEPRAPVIVLDSATPFNKDSERGPDESFNLASNRLLEHHVDSVSSNLSEQSRTNKRKLNIMLKEFKET